VPWRPQEIVCLSAAPSSLVVRKIGAGRRLVALLFAVRECAVAIARPLFSPRRQTGLDPLFVLRCAGQVPAPEGRFREPPEQHNT